MEHSATFPFIDQTLDYVSVSSSTMAEALQNIGNLWDQLSDLHQKDPDKYKEVIEESAKEYAKLKLPPLPHTCLLVRDSSNATYGGYFVNIMAWERLPQDKNGALPMAGGFLTRKFEKVIYSLAVNNKVLNDVMVKGSTEEKNDLIQLALAFLESRNSDLKVQKDSWSLIRGKDYEGNLNEIQQLFMTCKNPNSLKTENPKSLLHQLTQINQESEDKNQDDFSMKTGSESRKRLVQEINPKKNSKSSDFEENLKRKYSKEEAKKDTKKDNIKLFEMTANQLNAVSTKKLQPKKPLFGRAFCPQTEEVRLKFLLNGVEHIGDIFFFLPDAGDEGSFGLQTTNGYNVKDLILPGVIKEWQIQETSLDLTSNYPVFCVKLTLVDDKENNQ